MAGGYPNLFPSHFIEFDDDCSGPQLYRNQPSRENTDAPRLNDLINKYSTAEIRNFDFTNMLTYIKYLQKHWKKIPQHTRLELVDLLKNSNGPMSQALHNKKEAPQIIDYFTNESDSAKALENIISHYAPNEDIKVVQGKSAQGIMTLVIVSIVALFLGFLIATCVS